MVGWNAEDNGNRLVGGMLIRRKEMDWLDGKLKRMKMKDWMNYSRSQELRRLQSIPEQNPRFHSQAEQMLQGLCSGQYD